MITSTYWTFNVIALEVAEPEIECVCDPPPPAAPEVSDAVLVWVCLGKFPPEKLHPSETGIVWVWLGICDVLSVVAPALNPLVVIVGVWFVKTVVNAVVPPELAEPDTTRNALLSCVVDFVHPVGAAVCTNSMAVLVGKPAIAAHAPSPRR
jgi:hypothetical protein